MRIQKFLAPTFRDALAQVKEELGGDAMILSTKQVRRGVLGNGVEVTAATEAEEPETPPSVPPPAPPPPASAGLSDADVERVMAPLRSELRAMRTALRTITEAPPDNTLKNELAGLKKAVQELREFAKLREAGPPLAETAARSLIASPSKARAVMLVGPTGAGKTTTIAKLAAREALVHSKNVALVTLDSYRIGGEAQLRTFADLIGVPLTAAAHPAQLKKLLSDLSGFDRIFIDTAGRSPKDKSAIESLLPALVSRDDMEVHLTLSVAHSGAQLDACFRRYQALSPDRLLLTKLDEADDLSELVRAPARFGCPVSYISTGQRVPEDIDEATSEGLLALAEGEREGA